MKNGYFASRQVAIMFKKNAAVQNKKMTHCDVSCEGWWLTIVIKKTDTKYQLSTWLKKIFKVVIPSVSNFNKIYSKLR